MDKKLENSFRYEKEGFSEPRSEIVLNICGLRGVFTEVEGSKNLFCRRRVIGLSQGGNVE